MKQIARTFTRAGLVLVLGLALTAAAPAAEEKARQPIQSQEARTIQVKILGMSCPFCAYGVQQKLGNLEGVEELDVELETGLATLTMREAADLSNQILRRTVDEAGFEAAAIVRNFDSPHEDMNPAEISGEHPPGSSSPSGSV